MLKVTWDSGCFYKYENRTRIPAGLRDALQGMVDLHRDKRIELRLVASTAAELQQANPERYLRNYAVFERRRDAAGLQGVELLKPITQFDHTAFDHMVFGGGDEEAGLRAIFAAMTPGKNFDAPPSPVNPKHARRARQRWRADRLDADIYDTHRRNDGDLMVTLNTRDFIKKGKRAKLLKFGGRAIEEPVPAYAWLLKVLAAEEHSRAAGG
jgi:hypothetical protein